MGKNILSVYETETFLLVGKKSIKAENAVDFSWSPTDTILALFAHESGSDNQPARVSIYMFHLTGCFHLLSQYSLVELMLQIDIKIGDSCSNSRKKGVEEKEPFWC